jgi:hypothetical protein
LLLLLLACIFLPSQEMRRTQRVYLFLQSLLEERSFIEHSPYHVCRMLLACRRRPGLRHRMQFIRRHLAVMLKRRRSFWLDPYIAFRRMPVECRAVVEQKYGFCSDDGGITATMIFRLSRAPN